MTRWCFHWRTRRLSCKRGTCGHRGLRLTLKAFGEHVGPGGAPRLQFPRRLERGGAYQAGWSAEIKGNSRQITTTLKKLRRIFLN